MLDEFHLTNLNESLASEIEYLKKERENEKAKAKKKAEKDKAKKNDTEAQEEKKEPEPAPAEEEEVPIPTPKIKISIEFSRSGYMSVTKANAGSHFITVDKVRKQEQLSMELMR